MMIMCCFYLTLGNYYLGNLNFYTIPEINTAWFIIFIDFDYC